MTDFNREVASRVASYEENETLKAAASAFMVASIKPKYSYNFSFMGRPIIQYPQDMVAVQELIWAIRPDLIIETGIAHGGSLIMSAGMLALIDMTEAIEAGTTFDPAQSKRKVLGIDIDIHAHNRVSIDAHPMRSRIEMIEGSSIAPETIAQVKDFAKDFQTILVFLDSNHTHEHVLEELRAYAPLTSKESYCVVFDTIIEDIGQNMYPDRPWDVGDNPKTAVYAYIKENDAFEIDRQKDLQILISVAPHGFLKRTR